MRVPTFDPSSPLAALLTALGAGLLSGIVPTGTAEAAAVAIGLMASPRLAAAMWVAFTVGHVVAKLPWYGLGLHGDRVAGARAARWVVKARTLLGRRPQYGPALLFVSALTSIPPFHVAAIAAGLLRIAPTPFIALCLAGRLIRFGLLAASPGLLRALLGGT